jgi:hypothetical protein
MAPTLMYSGNFKLTTDSSWIDKESRLEAPWTVEADDTTMHGVFKLAAYVISKKTRPNATEEDRENCDKTLARLCFKLCAKTETSVDITWM